MWHVFNLRYLTNLKLIFFREITKFYSIVSIKRRTWKIRSCLKVHVFYASSNKSSRLYNKQPGIHSRITSSRSLLYQDRVSQEEIIGEGHSHQQLLQSAERLAGSSSLLTVYWPQSINVINIAYYTIEYPYQCSNQDKASFSSWVNHCPSHIKW